MKIGKIDVKIEEIDMASFINTQKRLDNLTKPLGRGSGKADCSNYPDQESCFYE